MKSFKKKKKRNLYPRKINKKHLLKFYHVFFFSSNKSLCWASGSLLSWYLSTQSATESITMLLYLPTKNTCELALFQDSHSSYCQYISWSRSYTLSSWCLQSFRKPSVPWQRVEVCYTTFNLMLKFFIDTLC